MEAYLPPVRGRALRFLSAWTTKVHALGYSSGVYSSSNSGIADLAHESGRGKYRMPGVIFDALWNGRADTADSVYSPGQWNNHHRLHQYRANLVRTYGGATLDIDRDFLDVSLSSPAPKPSPSPSPSPTPTPTSTQPTGSPSPTPSASSSPSPTSPTATTPPPNPPADSRRPTPPRRPPAHTPPRASPAHRGDLTPRNPRVSLHDDCRPVIAAAPSALALRSRSPCAPNATRATSSGKGRSPA